MLIAEVKRQGKEFGLLIDDIAGGFTFTGRGQPQAFQVQPLVVYEVFADGSVPDMLVRGSGYRRNPAGLADQDHGHGRYAGSLQRILRGGVGLSAGRDRSLRRPC